ncbi:MAG TPA: Ig-like domain-containing protein [Sedimentisphaerales bacterium]|nr:Ig-like domain-containing protein [Sedimentisphaerales bacterium]
MVALFNKKKAKAMAEIEERLKAESQARAEVEERLREEIEARATVEQKVKDETDKMLLTQYHRYSVLAERAEAQAKKEIVAAKAEAKEAIEKARSYAAALYQAEENLTQAQEITRTEAIARAKAEEDLNAEREEQQRIEAQAKEEIAAAKAEAEEKVRSYAEALNQAEEKLNEAKEQVRAETIVRAKAEEDLKAESKERQSLDAQPAETIKTFKPIRRNIFHPTNIKRKIALLSVLAIFTAIAFALSVTTHPLLVEPGSAITQENTPAPITLMESDTDAEQLTYNTAIGPSHGSLSPTAPSITYTPALNRNNPDNFVLKANDGNSIPALDIQSSTIKVNPVLLKIATSLDGKTNIVQYSDNERWETNFGSYIFYDFSDASIAADAKIKSVILFIEHFEEERFAQGKLEWAIGTGWPSKPVVWEAIKAPVHQGQSYEAVDAWDITSVVNTREKINSLQLQVKNNDNVAHCKTLMDYAYVIVQCD